MSRRSDSVGDDGRIKYSLRSSSKSSSASTAAGDVSPQPEDSDEQVQHEEEEEVVEETEEQEQGDDTEGDHNKGVRESTRVRARRQSQRLQTRSSSNTSAVSDASTEPATSSPQSTLSSPTTPKSHRRFGSYSSVTSYQLISTPSSSRRRSGFAFLTADESSESEDEDEEEDDDVVSFKKDPAASEATESKMPLKVAPHLLRNTAVKRGYLLPSNVSQCFHVFSQMNNYFFTVHFALFQLLLSYALAWNVHSASQTDAKLHSSLLLPAIALLVAHQLLVLAYYVLSLYAPYYDVTSALLFVANNLAAASVLVAMYGQGWDTSALLTALKLDCLGMDNVTFWSAVAGVVIYSALFSFVGRTNAKHESPVWAVFASLAGPTLIILALTFFYRANSIRALVALLLTANGAAAYLVKFPENISRKSFDLFGNSRMILQATAGFAPYLLLSDLYQATTTQPLWEVHTPVVQLAAWLTAAFK